MKASVRGKLKIKVAVQFRRGKERPHKLTRLEWRRLEGGVEW